MTLSQQGRDTLAFPNREFMKVYQDGIKRRGVVNMCLAENHVSRHLVHKKLASIRVDESSLSYADYCGDSDLRAAAAQFLTTFLKGRVATDDITAFNGVGSALLQLSLAVCDPGDTVAVPGPFYYGFLRDLTAFSKARIQCLPPAHQLTPPLLQGVYDDCMLAGHPLKLVVLCNPDNPTGTVTSPESVRSIASWCAQRGVHLMIDEIYALSVYRRKPFAFRSVLELFSDYGLPPFVHQVWGLSKDFCSSGLRCAFLVSRNAEVNAAVRKFAYFFQIGHPIQQQCAALLLDTAWVRGYALWGHSKDFCSSGLRCAFLVSRNAEVNAAVRKFAYFFHIIQQQCTCYCPSVHQAWGHSKDLCSSGLRYAFLVSRNAEVNAAVRKFAYFFFHIIQQQCAALLLDTAWGLSKDFCSSGLRCAFLVSRNAEVNAAVRKFAYFFHIIQQQPPLRLPRVAAEVNAAVRKFAYFFFHIIQQQCAAAARHGVGAR
eukprot:gene16670-25580_t